ncbi:MAG: 1-deoxy-D-xylulose-5-phosphate reductoisomerase [Muribaculaceae bacterium]|nr:1-deoxy-D-xylulose-5-phosphate reductoisomerase [Muribaculaceae bacterium]
MKSIAILGSTGSIGTQTVDLLRIHPDRFKASLLTAGRNVELLIHQARELRPSMAVIADESRYAELREALEPLGIATAAGSQAIADAMDRDDFSTVVTATVGYSGLLPTVRAIRAGKNIALANKETLVVAGELITGLLAEHPEVEVIPVDSEHSAIYQCLQGESRNAVERLIITASGGPFRDMSADMLSSVTVADALHHPNWQMGAKITIDSATMLNKAFEIIEARWLFGIEPERIKPVVHPQSIVHSMVEFADGAVKAQSGLPDMHLPISYALGERERIAAPAHMTLADYARLDFMEPDTKRFPCLTLAQTAMETGGTAACTINAANEIANEAFRKGRIRFTDIYEIITATLEKAPSVARPELDDYVAVNAAARSIATELVAKFAE